MATQVFNLVKLYVDGYDFTTDHNAFAFDYGAEALDDTVFGDTTRSMKGGLKTLAFNHRAYWNDADDGVDEQMFTRIGAGTATVVTAIPSVPADGAEGAASYIVQPEYSKYTIGGTVGELMTLEMEGAARSPFARATVLGNVIAQSSGVEDGLQLGAITSTQKMYIAWHVTAMTGSSFTVEVFSDDNGSFTSQTQRYSSGTLSTIQGAWATVSGPVTDDWWRVNFTVTAGLLTAVVSVAIL